MFEQIFKNIDDILHKDAGCGSELDYVEQTSWITTTYDLSAKNPHKKDETVLRDPQVILDEMKALDEESTEILKVIGGLV